MAEPFVFVFVGFILFALVLRLVAGSFDHERIRADIQRRGGEVIAIQWAPFGRGWFGERGDRIYNVAYRDAAGRERRASCKTSLFSGVYFHEDPAAEAPAAAPLPRFSRPRGQEPGTFTMPNAASEASELERLREENERLRRELERRG